MQKFPSQIHPLPAIEGVTVSHHDQHYLRADRLLDFIRITERSILFVTPLAVLYTTTGVRQVLPLRGIPVAVAGRVTYPLSSLSLPELHGRLIVNGALHRLKFQGSLISTVESLSSSDIALIGLALNFTVSHEASTLPTSPEQQ